jgi:hypothetical protein
MDFTLLYKQLLSDFNLQNLSDDDKKVMLLEISKTIQKQFLLDVHDILGKEKFVALQASASMGDEFYATTLKHLVPSYEEVFLTSRMKIVTAFKKETEGN